MTESNLHFYSKEVCNIYINGTYSGNIDNITKFYLDIVTNSQTIIITCEPVSSSTCVLLPYSFMLDLSKPTIQTLGTVNIIAFPKRHYDIHLTFNSAGLNTKAQLFSKKISNYNILALMDNISTYSIFKDDCNLHTLQEQNLSNFAVELNNKLICITARQQNKICLTLFNTQNEELLLHGIFDTIEQSATHIKTLKNMQPNLNYGEVISIDLSTCELQKYCVHLQDGIKLKKVNFVPLNFLECIKASDYSTARTYLNSTFSNVTEQKLQQYFGPISNIYYNCYHNKDDVFNYTITDTEQRNFNFYMHDNLITDIEEITI